MPSCCGCFIGHTFSHKPQLIQVVKSISGYRNPSLSSFIVIHCLGHMFSHAQQPQHWVLSVIVIIC